MLHLHVQPSLTLEKDSMPLERPSRPSRHLKKKQRVQAEPELSESDEYVDFSEQRHEVMAEFNTVIVGEETETSSAVQSIQQVDMKTLTLKFSSFCHNNISNLFFSPKTTRNGHVLFAEVPETEAEHSQCGLHAELIKMQRCSKRINKRINKEYND